MRIVVAALAVALVASGCDWLSWSLQGQHIGATAEPALDAAGSYHLDTVDDVPATGQVVTQHGLMFLVRDGELIARDAKSLAVTWKATLPAGSTVGATPAIATASNMVFVVVGTATGAVLLGYEVDGTSACNAVLYVCALLFQAQLGSSAAPATPPAVHGSQVFAVGANTLHAFNAAPCSVCTPQWTAPTGGVAAGVGPVWVNGVVVAATASSGAGFVTAFDDTTGAPAWSGALGAPFATAAPATDVDGHVFVPAGSDIAVFDAAGCGAATCAPDHTLVPPSTDASAQLLATPVAASGAVFATTGDGTLLRWGAAPCGTATCAPTATATIDQPLNGSPAYRQAPAPEVLHGTLWVAVRRVVSATNHVFVSARHAGDLAETASWDAGAADLGPALASVSIANRAVIVPTSNAVEVLRAPAPQPLATLAFSSFTLSPAFSPSTNDYTLRCASGTNSVSVSAAAVPGGSVALRAPITTAPAPSLNAPLTLHENDAVVVVATDAAGGTAEYWVRCLPHDFPAVTVTHPSGGTPTPGWYLLGDNIAASGVGSYSMILDPNGTPVWYRHAPAGTLAINVTPLGHDRVAVMQRFAAFFGTDPNGAFDVFDLDAGTTSTIRTVGVPTDLHELRLLGTATC